MIFIATKDRGKNKMEVAAALYRNKGIKKLLLGNTEDKSPSEVRELFQKHVKSHLFVDDTITDTDTFIFYDIALPRIYSNTKDVKIILYAICHRDILDGYSEEGYYGNRADILTQLIEECIVADKEIVNNFGIGKLSLESVQPYNDRRFYGYEMIFGVPNFR